MNCTVLDMLGTIWYGFCTMSAILETILDEWQNFPIPTVIRRDFSLNFAGFEKARQIFVVTGLRRAGKTFCLYQTINELLQTHTRKQVVYLNFEDERIPQETEMLTDLIPAIKKLYGQKPLYLFLDEIQNIPLWSKWLRRIFDTEKNIWLVVSGSSSKIGREEIPTELRGRFVVKQVYPLSFSEFDRFCSDEPDSFRKYLTYGGLPAVVLAQEGERRALIQDILETVIKRDIVDRYEISNQVALDSLMKLLFNSTVMTVSKLYNSLKSTGTEVGKTTVNKFIKQIESSYLLKQLYLYAPSVRAKLQYPRKIYFIDNGFLTAMSVKSGPNYGRLLENLVYWQLYKKHGDNLYYYHDERGEVDFCVLENGRAVSLYQVCYDLSDLETWGREIHSLRRVGKRLGVSDLNLVSGQIGETAEEKGIKVLDPLNNKLICPLFSRS